MPVSSVEVTRSCRPRAEPKAERPGFICLVSHWTVGNTSGLSVLPLGLVQTHYPNSALSPQSWRVLGLMYLASHLWLLPCVSSWPLTQIAGFLQPCLLSAQKEDCLPLYLLCICLCGSPSPSVSASRPQTPDLVSPHAWHPQQMSLESGNCQTATLAVLGSRQWEEGSLWRNEDKLFSLSHKSYLCCFRLGDLGQIT